MVTIQKPKLLTSLEVYTFEDSLEENYLEKVLIENSEFLNTNHDDFEFDGCHLKRIGFTNSTDINFSFIDSKLEYCDCSNLHLSLENVIRCHFLECKFVGLDLSEELIKDVIFENCDFSLANFSDVKFQNVRFQNCLFRDTRIFSSCFKEVEFLNCMLDHTEFYKSALNGIDLSSSTLCGGRFCIEDLKGAVVNSEQALALAKLLGIVIRDE